MDEAHYVGDHAGTPRPHEDQCRFRRSGCAVVSAAGAIGSGHHVAADRAGREREREREREKVEMRNFACWLAGREREDSKRLTYMKTRTPRKSTVLSVIGHFSSRFPTKALQLKT